MVLTAWREKPQMRVECPQMLCYLYAFPRDQADYICFKEHPQEICVDVRLSGLCCMSLREDWPTSTVIPEQQWEPAQMSSSLHLSLLKMLPPQLLNLISSISIVFNMRNGGQVSIHKHSLVNTK